MITIEPRRSLVHRSQGALRNIILLSCYYQSPPVHPSLALLFLTETFSNFCAVPNAVVDADSVIAVPQ